MISDRVREPVVAGMFYPENPRSLEDQLRMMIPSREDHQEVLGIICPHAGYVYSGSCAGKVYGQIRVPRTAVIMGVAHGPVFEKFGIEDADRWDTPFGPVPVNRGMAENLLERGRGLFEIRAGINSNEHSIEVQLPFLRFLNEEVQIVPILVSTHDLDQIKQAARILAGVIKDYPALMVASTDMSHYISAQKAEEKDALAINEIKALNPDGLMEVVTRNRISMCGVAPTTLLITAARQMGARSSTLVHYTHSGEVSGDFDQVVSYAGFTIP